MHMGAASPVKESDDKQKISSPEESKLGQNVQLDSGNIQSEPKEPMAGGSDVADTEKLEPESKVVTKNSSRSAYKKNKVSSKSIKRKYMLRSSTSSTRVLRSMSRGTSKPPVPSSNMGNATTESGKKRKRKKKVSKTLNDEFSTIRKRIRYLLTRMNYEQSLIDAYSGEGWKGNSLEKIKPEKELQRATAEILRCKLRIRELFQHLSSLCSVGRLQESLFDSEGQIYSEDIFCAKCGSKDLSTDNDIILCDGICDRGFHQMCLEPPLSKEEIPPGDEGWLCPGCDCKVDCIELLNELRGLDLSINDNWEKIFPEAAAAAAAGDNQDGDFGFPSDDSEDYDYDPNGPQVDDEKVQTDDSSSEESDFTSASDDSGPPPNDDLYLGLPSDDSEDNDYDPTARDPDEHANRESSNSDFTSDSEDFSALSDHNIPMVTDEIPVSSSVDGTKPLTGSSERSKMDRKRKTPIHSELLSKLQPDEENALPVSGKRHRELLDYKKLHDETYGNLPSDSSDDEDWTATDAPSKGNNCAVKSTSVSPNGNLPTINNGITTKGERQNLEVTNNTPKETHQIPELGDASHTADKTNEDDQEPCSIEKTSTTPKHRSLGKAVTQKLYEAFRRNRYPDRATKENLVKELGITLRQVSKWFENARRSLRLSANEAEPTSANKVSALAPENGKVLEPEPKMPSKDDATNDGMDRESSKEGHTEAVAMECLSGKEEKKDLETGESSQQKLAAPNSRKAHLDDQTPIETLNSGETPMEAQKGQATQKNDLNANQQGTLSGIRTRSRKTA
ncbi:PREDICTED: homeobox protein HOX1A [Nelumbo nucifera]|uniref:Homeobox protein HOX1A n=2 Tax=Nelumbo nucifera TaxID=4432 RepID=A0A1U8B6I6_NELNU|nr:PREDICTED: homeobox protein HOX1A [Nelumbo nucifera]XP_010271502.1 PREDICTED: homeobox protein HOX1A [Nelumbo nucifera]DAD41405.1 TPA_asm: hypothetical protein HUJ06_015728 [Nelumbo nucifera]